MTAPPILTEKDFEGKSQVNLCFRYQEPGFPGIFFFFLSRSTGTVISKPKALGASVMLV
jgi:hypothetical protein